MLKKIKDCTYKEVRDYYNKHISDTEVGMLLGAFGKPFVRNEQSWRLRMKFDFPKIFKYSFLVTEIDV